MINLERMAKNGYGHWLRHHISVEERRIKDLTWEISELENKANTLRKIIKMKEEQLIKDKASLIIINTKYADIEPPGEND